nr:MAG TPA: hypothetical protein [Caudoviricetes sp.]
MYPYISRKGTYIAGKHYVFTLKIVLLSVYQ